MKKFLLTMVCSLLFALPVYADTIITAPIDGRPISNEYLENIVEIGNDDFYTVSDDGLDFFSSYEPDNHLGNSEKVREEIYSLVSEHNNKYTTVIINTSSYITNGLVGSRCGVNYDNYTQAVEDLEKLVTDFPEPTYYVNLAVPRTLPETRFNEIWCNDEKLRGLGYYYLKYNENAEDYDVINSKYGYVTPTQYIMEFSYVANKAEEIGESKLTQWEKAFLNYFNNNIKNKAPYKEYVDYYKKPYEATASIGKQLIKMQKEGLIDQIVISNDDLQIPDSITYFYNKGCDWVQTKNNSPVKYSYARTYVETGNNSIMKSIGEIISKEELSKAGNGTGKYVNIIYGTDEVPQLIYARDYARRKYLTANIKFLYNDVSQNVSTFDVKEPGNIARTAFNFVKGDVGKYTQNGSTVYIYDYRLKTDKTASAQNQLKKDKDKGANIGLIELFDGTKENKIFKDLLYNKKRLSLADMDMYSAWNTNGNAIGLGVAHMQVISVAKETTSKPADTLKAQVKVMVQHSIEDGLYTKSGKLTLSNKGYKPNVQDRTKSQTLYELMDTEKITGLFEGVTMGNSEGEYKVDSVSIKTLNFPWGRTFDIYVDTDVEVSKVKNS